MPRGGQTVLGGRQEVKLDDPPGLCAGLCAGPCVVLAVMDTGQEMDAATLAQATEPFFTTKPVGKGAGLGLAMVHGLAAQSGGTLHIRSSPGQGTTIELWLPVAEGVAPSAAASPPAAAPRGAMPSRRVLVVDDPLVLASTAAALEDFGHRVIEAGSARDALGVLRAGTPVDLGITDQVMLGMTGLELATEVESLRAGLPILLASGFAELSEAKAARLPRLSKPFTQAALGRRSSTSGRRTRPATG